MSCGVFVIRSIMFFSHCFLLTLMCIAFTLPFVESADMTTRNWLYRNLTDTKEYVKYLRPVNDSYQTVEVGFRFDPFIHELDYINQELQLRGTLDMTWYDFRLSWNPDDYDDLQYIELPLNEIWQPELILYERMSKHNDESFQTETDIVKVYNTGKVDWVTIASTRTFCSINVDKFPKDEHTCDVTFTTWLHQDNEQKLHILGNMDSCEFEHLTWRLKFTDLGGNDPLYRCDHYLKNQSYVRYIATLERLDTNFGMYTLVVPNILVSVLSVFTICFPSGDRNGPAFGLMCLLALIIQLGILYQVLPDTAFSKVGQSLAFLSIAVAFETVFSVINMGIEDVIYIVSKMKNIRCLILKKKESRRNRKKIKEYERLRGNDRPKPNPGDKTEMKAQNKNLDSKSAEGSPIPLHIPAPVMAKDASTCTCTQFVIRFPLWCFIKFVVALGFLAAIIWINVHMVGSLSN
ncbi:neuronal acetylcholine receptor subunit alpha-9-II-like [Apostichopus japonicus]|uniref:neuronal acetylcholine receptor subunit alpha-9-II-like n=1 Tax=Stichopus japonicus TaxID=307972 RepID=UPI003AB3AA23